MTQQPVRLPSSFRLLAPVALFLLSGVAGCKKAPAPIDDATLANNVHTALTSDSSITSEPIQSSVANGVVTLNGNVSNDTARLVAAEDAARVTGVKEVVNDLSIQGVHVVPTITTAAAPQAPRIATREERQHIARHEPLAPVTPVGAPYAPAQTAQNAPPPQYNSAPPPPPVPVYRDITVPAGTPISVRITQTLDSATTQEGAPFSGVVTNSVVIDGESAIPAGSGVVGRVVAAHDAGHFSGNSLLTLELTGITRRGQRIAVGSEPYSVQGNGRGKNTAEKVGGGAAVGAILGGIFGGGKGAAIGAASGGALGAGANAVTRGQQVQITSESVVRFRLANSFTVRSAGRTDETTDPQYNGGYPNNNGSPNSGYPNNNGGLQQRPPQQQPY